MSKATMPNTIPPAIRKAGSPTPKIRSTAPPPVAKTNKVAVGHQTGPPDHLPPFFQRIRAGHDQIRRHNADRIHDEQR